MIITEEFLNEKGACVSGVKWFRNYEGDRELIPILNALIADDKHDDANWLIVRCMTKDQYVRYAIFAAEQVIDIFKKKYPEDNRPRTAIEKAKEYLQSKTKIGAADDAYVAYVAAYAADAAADDADAAADDADAAHAARKEMRERILRYGISLL